MSSDSEDEVLGVDVTSDEDEDLSDMAPSDVEGQEDDDIPNIHAWGKDKRKYYSTDYVDQDYGGYQGRDAALADQEEEEAANLHKELTQKLNEAAFSLDFIETKVEDKSVSHVSETDINKLSKRQKVELLKKESPEFFGLVDEYRAKNGLLNDFLNPVMELSKVGKIPDCDALTFVSTLKQLVSNYCMCINFYFLLKTSKKSVANHPVIKRMNQFRELIVQMEPIFEEVTKPQIEILLQLEKEALETSKLQNARKKTLKVLENLSAEENAKKKDLNKTKKAEKVVSFEDMHESEEEGQESMEIAEGDDNLDEAVVRRPITYQIAKNKGLTPHRKKEQRNPRVKYKNKFRKATIRRKGAVRTVRTEMSRYGGEISGIKASVSKSIKLKS